MKKTIANAMLCLLLLLSVASARCDSLCAAMSMSRLSGARLSTARQAPQSAMDVSMSMPDGMEHCAGMVDSKSTHTASAGCSSMNCRYESFPATPDPVVSSVDAAQVAPQLLLTAEPVVPPATHADRSETQSSLLPLSPLIQGSILRV